eukprot:1917008-Prymnesium_polylepis.1
MHTRCSSRVRPAERTRTVSCVVRVACRSRASRWGVSAAAGGPAGLGADFFARLVMEGCGLVGGA